VERIRGRLVAASARHTTPQHSPIIAQYIVFLAEVWRCFPKPQAVARRDRQPNCPLTRHIRGTHYPSLIAFEWVKLSLVPSKQV
jgi:hypothetical protein